MQKKDQELTHYCFTTALLLLYLCFTTALLYQELTHYASVAKRFGVDLAAYAKAVYMRPHTTVCVCVCVRACVCVICINARRAVCVCVFVIYK
jgi:hypothetical protein